MTGDRTAELYRWDPNNNLVTSGLGLAERVISPTTPMQRVLEACRGFLKPGWENRDTYRFYYGDHDLTYPTPSSTAELLYIFENPARLGLTGGIFSAVDMENVLVFPSDRLVWAELATDNELRLPDEATEVVDRALDTTPYQCSEVGVRFNNFKAEDRKTLLHQTGVLVLDLMLEDARVVVDEMEEKVAGHRVGLLYCEKQLEVLKPIAVRTEELFPATTAQNQS